MTSTEINVYIEGENEDTLHFTSFYGNDEINLATSIDTISGWLPSDTSYFQAELVHKAVQTWWSRFLQDFHSATKSLDSLWVLTFNTYYNDDVGHAQVCVIVTEKWKHGAVRSYIIDPDGTENANWIVETAAASILFALNELMHESFKVKTTETVLSPFLNTSSRLRKRMLMIDEQLIMTRSDDVDMGQCVSVCTFVMFLLATVGRRVLRKDFFQRNIIAPLTGEKTSDTEMNVLAFFRAWSYSLLHKRPGSITYEKATGLWRRPWLDGTIVVKGRRHDGN